MVVVPPTSPPSTEPPAEAPAEPAASSTSDAHSNSSPPIKIIFLDVDGVICCNGAGRLETDKLARMKSIVERTGAVVVLSTDWRRDAMLKATITGALETQNIKVIGATRKGAPLQPIRPKEISGWLDSFIADKNRTVSEWVAVDDRELMAEQGGERLRGHFVNTSFASGLTDKVAERMVAVLNGDKDQGMGSLSNMANAARRAGSPARGGRRAASPGKKAGAEAGAPAAARPGFNAATAPGGCQSSLPSGGGRGGSTPTRGGAGARAGAPGCARASGPGGPRAESPGKVARAAAFGGAKPGLVSPTCARAHPNINADGGSRPSTPAAAPAAACSA